MDGMLYQCCVYNYWLIIIHTWVTKAVNEVPWQCGKGKQASEIKTEEEYTITSVALLFRSVLYNMLFWESYVIN